MAYRSPTEESSVGGTSVRGDGGGDEVDGNFAIVDALFNSFVPTTKETITSDVLQSQSLGWSWSFYNGGVYHTAVVLYLDGIPKYSVNWGPRSGTYTHQLWKEVEGEIAFGVEPAEGDESITYKAVMGTVNISDLSEAEIMELLGRLFTFDESHYHLIHCNCRDHVLRVMKAMGISDDEYEEMRREIDDIRPAVEWFLKLTSR